MLRPEAADYAADLVRSGDYCSFDDVVSDALVALDERRARERVGEIALRERLRRAVAELDRGDGIAGAPDVVIGEIFEEALAQSRPSSGSSIRRPRSPACATSPAIPQPIRAMSGREPIAIN